MPPEPDIKNGLPTPVLVLGGIAILLVVVVILGFIFKSDESEELNDDDSVFQRSELPSNFFDLQEVKEPEPEPEPVPEIKPKPVIIEKKVKEYKFISSADMFKKPDIDPRLLVQARQRAEFNRNRRGAGVLLVEKGKPTFTRNISDEWNNTDESFDGQGQDVASYPVNLERTITVDRNLPAILINAIQSDLAGKVVAQIEHHIYGAQGKNILIPAGSKAIGYYEPLKKAGQERVAIAWSRIITPQGININTTDAELADAMGRSGLTGDVDRRNIDRFGMALLVSTVNALAQSTVPVTSESQKIALETYGRDISLITGTILEEQIDIKPRLSIPAGARILISPVVDIWFKKPVKNIVQAQKSPQP